MKHTKEKEELLIRAIRQEEWKHAIRLVWRTFLKFDAPYCGSDGVRSFYDYIMDERLYKLYLIGSVRLYGAYMDSMLVGVMGLRGEDHISMLFIDEDYQKRGVGKCLLRSVLNACGPKDAARHITVNASLYAVGFYRHLGFIDVEGARNNGGIISVPMELCARGKG